MSWDPVWEHIFLARPWGRYPPEEVVRFIARTFHGVPDRSQVRILELGCGPGSGTSWLIAREGFALAGIDGSRTAIETSRARFAKEGYSGEFVLGDVTRLPWPADTFDAVVDVACLACNTEIETAHILSEVRRVLKPRAWHFSITPKAGCWGDGTGERLDATTCFDVTEGPFAHMGKARFATEASLRRLYGNFADLRLEYELRSVADRAHEVSHWILTCRK